MRISRLFKRLRRLSSQKFRKRHSPAAFRTCRNAGNSVLTAEETTSKWTGSISCEAEFCIFYRLSLWTLRTKDVFAMLCIRYLRVSPGYENQHRIWTHRFMTPCLCLQPKYFVCWNGLERLATCWPYIITTHFPSPLKPLRLIQCLSDNRNNLSHNTVLPLAFICMQDVANVLQNLQPLALLHRVLN
jgi:hypothetical protein